METKVTGEYTAIFLQKCDAKTMDRAVDYTWRQEVTYSRRAPGYFTYSMTPPAACDSCEVARCFPHTGNRGPIWCLSGS